MSGEVRVTIAQGWYEDPSDAAHFRWWDGLAWTQHLQPKQAQPAPTPVPVLTVAAPAAVVEAPVYVATAALAAVSNAPVARFPWETDAASGATLVATVAAPVAPVMKAVPAEPVAPIAPIAPIETVQAAPQLRVPTRTGPDLRTRVPAQALLERLADLQAIGGFALDIDYTKVRIGDDARSWYLGALGERRVGKLLTQLGPEWAVLNSVPVGSSTSDIDHIVIGPGGVFTINTKNHSGATVWVRGRGLMVNGQKQRYLAHTTHEAERAAKKLSQATGIRVPVTGVLAFVGLKKLDIREAPHAEGIGIALWHERELVKRLTNSPRVLDQQQVQAIVDVANNPHVWHVRPRPQRDVSALERDFEVLEQGVRHQDRIVARRKVLGGTIIPVGLLAAAFGAWALWSSTR
jgi:hypothetical protein